MNPARHIVVVEHRPGVFGTLELGRKNGQWVGTAGHYDESLPGDLESALWDMIQRAGTQPRITVDQLTDGLASLRDEQAEDPNELTWRKAAEKIFGAVRA
jgi:hypothetical protein